MRLMSIILAAALLAPAAHAAEGESFFDMLRKKIESIAPKKKLVVTTTAGGVRGDISQADDLYWAGSATPSDEELEAFRAALAAVEAGNKKVAKSEFKEFIKRYPGSPLKADAVSALAEIDK